MRKWILFAGLLVSAGTLPLASAQTSRSEIRALAQQLGHREYAKRVAAQRRLIELGPAVVDELRAMAADEGGEVAVRAREILTGLSRQLFTGVRVTLEGPDDPVSWDAPAALVVTMRNESAYPARVPFLPEDHDPARTVPVALEAARLIDMADYLRVTGPDDQPIPLHVDDIKELPELDAAVQQRLVSEAVTVLPPGKTLRFAFSLNRGWARYRCLASGAYGVQLVYIPQWEDEALRAAGLGVVRSNRIAVRVEPAAPRTLLQGDRTLVARLTRQGDAFAVELMSLFDVPLHVNTQIGRQLGRTAVLSWIVRWMDQAVDIRVPESAVPNEEVDDNKTLVRLDPGERVPLASLPMATLLEHEAVQAIPVGATFTVEARYVNQFSRYLVLDGPDLIRERVLPKGMSPTQYAAQLPARIFTGVAASNEIEVRRPE